MKAKIKALTGKTVRLWWNENGWYHNIVGVIGKIYDKEFNFKMNDEKIFKVKYINVTDFKEIKTNYEITNYKVKGYKIPKL